MMGAWHLGFVTLVLTSDVQAESIRCMRTTLDIEAPVLKDLRELQRREGGTLGDLVSRLLAEALARRPKRGPAPRLEWTARPMGARVDLADKDVVYAILDRADRAAEP
jgi:hypothetical protein